MVHSIRHAWLVSLPEVVDSRPKIALRLMLSGVLIQRIELAPNNLKTEKKGGYANCTRMKSGRNSTFAFEVAREEQ